MASVRISKEAEIILDKHHKETLIPKSVTVSNLIKQLKKGKKK